MARDNVIDLAARRNARASGQEPFSLVAMLRAPGEKSQEAVRRIGQQMADNVNSGRVTLERDVLATEMRTLQALEEAVRFLRARDVAGRA